MNEYEKGIHQSDAAIWKMMSGRVTQFEKDSFVGVNIEGKRYIKKAFIEMKKKKTGTDMTEEHKNPIMMEKEGENFSVKAY